MDCCLPAFLHDRTVRGGEGGLLPSIVFTWCEMIIFTHTFFLIYFTSSTSFYGLVLVLVLVVVHMAGHGFAGVCLCMLIL